MVFQLNLKYLHVKITNLLRLVVWTNNSMICTWYFNRSQQVTQQLVCFLTDQNLVGVHSAKERLSIPSLKFGSFIFMAASNSPGKNLPPYRSRYGCTWQFSRSCKIVFFLTLWGRVKNIKIQMYIPDNANQIGNTEEGTKQRKMIKQRRLVTLF